MAEALVNSLAPAGNLNDTLPAETQVPGIKATDDLITTLTRLAISHDRQLQTLEDRHTVIALIYGQQEKAKVRGIRDEWQRQKPNSGALHPSGASQRSVIWSQIFGHSTTALPRADHEGCNRRTPSGQIRGTAGTARITWLRHCIRSSQPVLRSYHPARCNPYSRGGKNCISPPAQAPEPEERGRQDMGVDIGVGPVSVISNNQRCRDCSFVRCKAVGDQVATSIKSGRPSCKTAPRTHQGQRQGQGERKKQNTLRQPRPRRGTRQQEEEMERRLVGLSRRLVATRHDGVLFNQCYFMPFLDKQSHEVCCEGPPPSGPCGGVGGAKWLLALSGAPRKLLTKAVRGTLNNWVSSATRNVTSFPGMVSLWPTYPPTHSTTNSGLRLKSIPIRRTVTSVTRRKARAEN